MSAAVIVSARRSAIGKFMGSFADTSSAELGGQVVKAAVESIGLKGADIGELIFGNGRQAGGGPNVARQVVRRAGLPDEVPAYTINKACASGLKAITLAAQSILAGESDVIVAGGTESMTRLPFLLDRERAGYRLGHAEVVDAMYRDGFLCPLCGELMGQTAENLADRYSISRSEQDHYASDTQQKCERARKAGRFRDEIVGIAVKTPDGPKPLEVDEHARDGVTPAAMAKLPPVFRKDGTVHAGNSSGITDGAAAVVVMSDAKAKALGIRPLARITGASVAGVDPKFMGIGPVPAIRKLESKTGVKLDQYDLVELNEAFAAQVIACDRELKFDRSRLNVNGGAIALGHPIGATGARIVVTLLHEMKKRGARRGLATLCVSGGLGMAVGFEMEPS